jgi:hypothetical protein
MFAGERQWSDRERTEAVLLDSRKGLFLALVPGHKIKKKKTKS